MATDPFAFSVADIPDGEVIYDDPILGIRKTKYRIDDKHSAIKTEYFLTDALLAANAEDRAHNAGTSWGDGKIIGRIPFHLMMDKETGLHDAMKSGDQAYIRKFLNENSKFKTRDKI